MQKNNKKMNYYYITLLILILNKPNMGTSIFLNKRKNIFKRHLGVGIPKDFNRSTFLAIY